MKKIIAKILFIITLLTSVPVQTFAIMDLLPNTVPVFDTSNKVVIIPFETTKFSLEKAIKAAISAAKISLLNMIVDQTITWIQGGGKPKFVSDWRGLLEDAGQEAAGEFIKGVGAGFLCESFSLQVQLSLLPVQKFSQQASCTLDDIVKNINDFRNDFRNGGWIAYSESWQPQNNYFGVSLMATAELERQRSAASGAAWSEALAGQGFLSTKKCQQDKNGKDIPGTCVVTTPGKTIGDTVAKAVGADIDFIVNAEDLSDYVGAISNALINRIIAEGVNGLKGTSGNNAPSGGFIPTGVSGTCAGLSGSTLINCQNYIRAYGNNFQFSKDGLINIINLTAQPREDAITLINRSISTLEDYIKSASEIYNELSNLKNVTFCKNKNFFDAQSVNKQILMENIQQNIKNEQSIINRLRQDLVNNQSILDPLKTTKEQISKLSSSDHGQMTTLFNGVSNKLDAMAAINFNDSAETELSQIRQRTSENLSQYNNDLIKCQNTQ